MDLSKLLPKHLPGNNGSEKNEFKLIKLNTNQN